MQHWINDCRRRHRRMNSIGNGKRRLLSGIVSSLPPYTSTYWYLTARAATLSNKKSVRTRRTRFDRLSGLAIESVKQTHRHTGHIIAYTHTR